jgi:hypothetical protein
MDPVLRDLGFFEAMGDKKRPRETRVESGRLPSISEKAMPIIRGDEAGSPQARLLRSVRLSLGGAALGVSVMGIVTKLGGLGDYVSIDVIGAVAGAMIAAFLVARTEHH